MPVEVWVEFNRHQLTEAMFPPGEERPSARIINLNKAEAVNTADGKVRIKVTVDSGELIQFINGAIGGRQASEDKYLFNHAQSA